jgi:hypothetical protein
MRRPHKNNKEKEKKKETWNKYLISHKRERERERATNKYLIDCLSLLLNLARNLASENREMFLFVNAFLQTHSYIYT